MVLVLTACPAGLRGDITRWLMEIAPGVFVGHVSKRVRENLWQRVRGAVGRGKALLVYSARNEQRLCFDTVNHDWIPTDFEGLNLMLRPHQDIGEDTTESPNQGWSTAARVRKFGRDAERMRRRQG